MQATLLPMAILDFTLYSHICTLRLVLQAELISTFFRYFYIHFGECHLILRC